MDEDKRCGSFGLFLPLTGQEQASRLEEKFGHYLDSDEESALTSTSSMAKMSRWNVHSEDFSEWLHSQRGTSSFISQGRGKHSLQHNKKRSNQHDKKQMHGHKSVTSKLKKDQCTNKDLEIQNKATDDISIAGSLTTVREKMNKQWQNENNSQPCCSKSLERKGMVDLKFNDSSPSDTREDKIMAEDGALAGAYSWTGFSSENTERPKLAIKPLSDKTEVRLSASDVQPPVTVPASINQYLRDYQREGIRFLYKHYIAKSGAILGDDMGLGKTIQVIGFLSALLGKQGNQIDTIHSIPKFIRQMSDDMPSSPPRRARKPFLIIGPSAVMYNWLDELNTWGYFTASKFHGADKDVCFENLKKGKLEIVVTTFETFRDNATRLNEVDWEAVIVDEVHKIKGLKAQVTQALRTINTPCRFGLTGTALQNNMTELWSLLDWVQPGVLGSLEEFETEYVHAIETGQRHDANKRELAQARKQRDKFSVIRKKMLLRRTKALIADQLPSKEDLVVICRLSELQISVYKAILAHPDMELVLRAEDPCECHSGKKRVSCCFKYSADGTKAWALVFSFMHLLLKTANHTALLIPDKSTKKKQAILAKSVCETAFKDHPQFLEQAQTAVFRTLSDPKYCGKMKILQGLLNVFYANHDKVLVFSYSTKLLDIIEQHVISQGHTYRRIDGKVSSRHRRDIVYQFNRDSSIFLCLISTKSGGLGLNLTGANRVVIFDPNWNPSHDLQAQDRAYRIGQTRDVKVYRLVSAGTIEENIYLRQIYKQQLDEVAIGTNNARRYFHGIQGDKGNYGELFGIKNMFSLRIGDSCLTMDILKRNDKLERCLAGYDITRYVPPPSQDSMEDSMRDDEESSDHGSSVDSDEEEEDEFLRDLFDSESIAAKSATQQMSSRCPGADPSGNIQGSTSVNGLGETARNMESDSDDGEFSLIPRLYHKSQHLTSEAKNMRNRPSDFSTSSQNCTDDVSLETVRKQGDLHGDTFSLSDITFSARTCPAPEEVLQKPSESPETRKRGAISAISWLFSESEGDEDIEETDRKKGPKRLSVELGIKQSRTSPSARSVHEESNNSDHCVRDYTGHARTSSAPKKKSKSAKISTVRGKKSGIALTSEENLLQEHLVLKNSDVLHTHMNAQVVGASRAEDHMTNCAMKDVFELHTNSQVLALQCDPYSQEDKTVSKKRASRGKHKPGEHPNRPKCISSGSYKILVGQTPTAIVRQQWSDLCTSRGVDELTMAETLLKADMKNRLDILREFYSQKHPELREVLAQVFIIPQTDHGPEKDQGINKTELPHLHKHMSSTDPSGRKLPRHPSSRGRSRSDVRKRRILVASSAHEKSSTGSSQSQDSMTENQDSSLDDKSGDFLPQPPSSSKKQRFTAKVKLQRSKTRLREKVKTNLSGKRLSHDKIPASSGGQDRAGDAIDQSSLDPSLLGISTSQIKGDSNAVPDFISGNQMTMQPEISSLLHEMGQKVSKRKERDPKSCTSAGSHSAVRKCRTVKHNKEHGMLSCSDNIITGKTVSKSDRDENNVKTEQSVILGKRNFASVLDDIFSLEEPMEEHSPSRKTDEAQESRSHRLISDDKKHEVSIPSSRFSKPSKVMAKEDRNTSQFETDSDLFGDFLQANTLKDEKMDSFIRPKKNQGQNDNGTRKCSDGGVKTSEDKKLKYDIDDLDWCKFTTGSSSPHSQGGSESLFS